MTRRSARPASKHTWTTFREVDDWHDAFAGSASLARRLPNTAAASRIDDHFRSGRCFRNNRYSVIVVEVPMPVGPDAIHLLMMPRDNRPGGSWSDLQRIKNEVVGREIEMYQVHPPEDETVDAEHTYHLWGYRDTHWRLPLGLDRPLHLFRQHDFNTSDGTTVRGIIYLPAPVPGEGQ